VTRVLSALESSSIEEAAAVLRAGGIVAFPTETVYGLGANAFDARAVARVFATKGRPAFDPLIVHLHSAEALPRVADGSDERVSRLAERFWPGPLTLVLRRTEAVPEIVTSGLDTVGVRVPGHLAAQALLQAVGVPLAAPSANPFGYVSPTTAAHVAEQLGDAVDLVLDGGPCRVGIESTILSLAPEPVLLRPGGVAREDLEAVLGIRIPTATPGARVLAPGTLPSHYAPRTPLRLLDAPAPAPRATSRRVGLLAFTAGPHEGYAVVERVSPDGSLVTAAANLFAALRRLDAAGLDLVLAEPCPEVGLGLAIMDRLRRAAGARA
jgi:L-threonylcarbamoyladenylate synthase